MAAVIFIGGWVANTLEMVNMLPLNWQWDTSQRRDRQKDKTEKPEGEEKNPDQ